MLLAVSDNNGILYSTGTDLSLRSWTLDTLGALGKVEVNIIITLCAKLYLLVYKSSGSI